MYKQTTGWSLLVLISSSLILHTLAYAYPNQPSEGGFVPSRTPQLPAERIERKFAEKPNAIKKASFNDIDDISTNSIENYGGGGGFSWSNILGMVMQMLFNPGGQAANKSDSLDDGVAAPSPWANFLSLGLKILTAILGGGASTAGDGIDKVDHGSPMQGIIAAVLSALTGARDPEQVNTIAKQAGEFITIVMNLLDALKASFSQRSMAARHIGRKDSISDAAIAGISMTKAYVRALTTADNQCMQKYMCDANRECTSDVGQSSIFCHLGSYATSFLMEQSTGSSFDVLYEAGRRGRSGDNCHQAYLECNEV